MEKVLPIIPIEIAERNLAFDNQFQNDREQTTLYIRGNKFYLINHKPSEQPNFSKRLLARLTNIFIKTAALFGIFKEYRKDGVNLSDKTFDLYQDIQGRSFNVMADFHVEANVFSLARQEAK
jgi:hypothetical protein